MSFSNSEKKRLQNRYGSWALITGASSGIGKALAHRIAESGLNVLLTARRTSLLDEIATEVTDLYGVHTTVVEADLTQDAGIDKVLEAAEGVEVGLLVAAAGFGTSGLFLDSKVADELNMLSLNCKALLVFTHHFSRRFARQGRGGIILLSSMVGFQGVPYAAHYAATKAYVQSLGEALSVELKDSNVDVLAAAPGPVSSGFATRANMQMDKTLRAEDIAVPILKALGRKSTILPGLLTKFLVGSLRTVPRWGKVRIMKLVMGGMTKHQRSSPPRAANPKGF